MLVNTTALCRVPRGIPELCFVRVEWYIAQLEDAAGNREVLFPQVGCAWSETMFMWVVCVKVASTWMPVHKVSHCLVTTWSILFTVSGLNVGGRSLYMCREQERGHMDTTVLCMRVGGWVEMKRQRQREKKRKERRDCVVLWWKAWLIREWWLQ